MGDGEQKNSHFRRGHRGTDRCLLVGQARFHAHKLARRGSFLRKISWLLCRRRRHQNSEAPLHTAFGAGKRNLPLSATDKNEAFAVFFFTQKEKLYCGVVTEVFVQREGGVRKLAALSFTRLITPPAGASH